MVRGIDLFREHFATFADQYVLIGGTAATFAMADAGLAFRATKDLDIVLHVEALTPAFGEAFWGFLERGAYEIRQASATGKPVFYRFQKPASAGFPAMLELFCRAPDGFHLTESTRLTPIRFEDSIASLSAILLDDDYYRFIIDGRRQVDGVPWIGAEQLIPLKAHAWLDLSTRKNNGEKIDSSDVRKHANDIIRLSQLLSPDSGPALASRISDDVNRFLTQLAADETFDPRKLQLNLTLPEIVSRLRRYYAIQ